MPRPTDAQVLARVDAVAEDMLSFLAATVREPSESGWEDRVTGRYADWFAARGWPLVRQPLEPTGLAAGEPRPADRENLIVWYPRRRGLPCLVLNGHVDVVPAGDEQAWSRPPHSGARAGGKVHGRGSVDMKGGIAAGLYALAALEDLRADLPFDVAVQLVVAEETTGVGTRAAALEVPDPAAALVLEPTGGAIVPISTGLLFFTVDVTGVAAHTSAPWRGVDAFDKLIRVREALAELARKRGAAYRHPLFADVPTAIPFAIGTARAGSWRAAVPDHATMSGRIGLVPGEAPAELRQEVERVLAEVAATDDWLRDHPPAVRWDHEGLPGWETPTDHELVAALRSAQRAATGEETLTGFTAGSDAAFFGARGVPTAIFGPGDVTLAHAPDECVAEADVVRAAKVLALALTRMVVRGG
ncbi:M20 family metallopeptidase [Amycolatopsis viridis]|uniref:Acetylornithine deacetylase n=1 Tax=Amycolatopsis viridis TaxID=185678 RepID=A0ABX0SXS2_9PSEU|nr:ArgE/DapE family deacylase [Amycolatopsis viridis]NIH80429.1 acetylornithine deacetylase [Amycolatopsis viridis]